MALNTGDPETDRLARELAALTGETETDAVRTALEDRLAREQRRRGSDIERRREAIDAVVQRFARLPVLDGRSADDILDYDENGLPT